MNDLSLHILDLVQNSVAAGADTVWIDLKVKDSDRMAELTIKDNGCGIPDELIKNAGHIPFTTKVCEASAVFGYGLYDFCNEAVDSGGSFEVAAPPEGGTVVKASFNLGSGIRPGNISDTIYSLWIGNGDVRFIFSYQDEMGHFELDTVNFT